MSLRHLLSCLALVGLASGIDAAQIPGLSQDREDTEAIEDAPRTIEDVRSLLGDPGGGALFGLEPALHLRSGLFLTAAAAAGLVLFGLAGFWLGHRARKQAATEAGETP